MKYLNEHNLDHDIAQLSGFITYLDLETFKRFSRAPLTLSPSRSTMRLRSHLPPATVVVTPYMATAFIASHSDKNPALELEFARFLLPLVKFSPGPMGEAVDSSDARMFVSMCFSVKDATNSFLRELLDHCPPNSDVCLLSDFCDHLMRGYNVPMNSMTRRLRFLIEDWKCPVNSSSFTKLLFFDSFSSILEKLPVRLPPPDFRLVSHRLPSPRSSTPRSLMRRSVLR